MYHKSVKFCIQYLFIHKWFLLDLRLRCCCSVTIYCNHYLKFRLILMNNVSSSWIYDLHGLNFECTIKFPRQSACADKLVTKFRLRSFCCFPSKYKFTMLSCGISQRPCRLSFGLGPRSLGTTDPLSNNCVHRSFDSYKLNKPLHDTDRSYNMEDYL